MKIMTIRDLLEYPLDTEIWLYDGEYGKYYRAGSIIKVKIKDIPDSDKVTEEELERSICIS